jgi:hypothetical protein
VRGSRRVAIMGLLALGSACNERYCFRFFQNFQVNQNLPWFKIYLSLLEKFQIK